MTSPPSAAPLAVWLLDNLRPEPQGAPPPNLSDPAQGREALQFIHFHRIALALSPKIFDDPQVPPAWRADLAALRRARAMRLLRMASETARLGGALDAAGVPYVVLKGLSAGIMLHGGLAARDAVDIDLAIPSDAVGAASAALQPLGYQRVIGREDGPDNPYPPSVTVLVRPPDSWTVELHGELAEDPRLFPLERLFDISIPMNVGSYASRCLPREEAVVYAAFHGWKHLWERLVWLTDIAAACRSDMDWAAAVSLARRLGCVRPLVLSVRLARDLLGAPVPQAVGDSGLLGTVARPAARLAPLICAASPVRCRDMFYRIGLARVMFWDVWMRQGAGAKIAVLQRSLKPTADDRRLARLPRSLYGLYLPLRILRLAYVSIDFLIKRMAR